MNLKERRVLFEEAWKQVFHVDAVTDNSDFFEEGGDSIMAVQLASWLIQKGVKLDLADIFTTPRFSDLLEKLTEAQAQYVPDALLTKEIAAEEMKGTNFEAFANAMKADASANNQLRQNDQQVCTPQTNDQQVCTPQQPSNQQVCTPQTNNQQVCTPQQPSNQQVCTPQTNNQQVCTPQQQQVYTPAAGFGMMNMSNGVPPQLEKYLSKPVDKPIEKPNVIKLEKAKVAKAKVSAEEALKIVLDGILKSWKKEGNLFEQGLTSFDTVKIVTRCGENGYEISMKDIYNDPTFESIVKAMKAGK